MPPLIFRPNFLLAFFALASAILVAAQVFIVATLGSFWFALPLCLPFMAVCGLCLFALRRAWRERVKLTGEQIVYVENANRHVFRLDGLASICVSRWEAFDAQAPIMLVLESRDGRAATEWNLADFGLKTNLRIAVELARRADLSSLVVTLHETREGELRVLTKRLGTLTLLPKEAPPEGKSKSWFATFRLTPHR